MVMGGTAKTGEKLKVDPARPIPVTRKFGKLIGFALVSNDFGLTEVMFGIGRKVKLLLDVTVCPFTVTVIGPLVAVPGTVTSNAVGEATKT